MPGSACHSRSSGSLPGRARGLVDVLGTPMPSGGGWRWPRPLPGGVPIPGKAPRPLGHVLRPVGGSAATEKSPLGRVGSLSSDCACVSSSHARVCLAERSRVPQPSAPPPRAASRLLGAEREPSVGHVRAEWRALPPGHGRCTSGPSGVRLLCVPCVTATCLDFLLPLAHGAALVGRAALVLLPSIVLGPE